MWKNEIDFKLNTKPLFGYTNEKSKLKVNLSAKKELQQEANNVKCYSVNIAIILQ